MIIYVNHEQESIAINSNEMLFHYSNIHLKSDSYVWGIEVDNKDRSIVMPTISMFYGILIQMYFYDNKQVLVLTFMLNTGSITHPALLRMAS